MYHSPFRWSLPGEATCTHCGSASVVEKAIHNDHVVQHIQADAFNLQDTALDQETQAHNGVVLLSLGEI